MDDALLVLYAGTHLVSAVSAGALGYWVLFRTEIRSRRCFSVLVFTLGVWSLVATAGVVLSGRNSQLLMQYLSLVIGGSIPLMWVVFAASYTHRSVRTNPLVRLLVAVYLVLVAAMVTNPLYGLYAPVTVRETPFPHVDVGVGAGRALGVVYVLVSLACGIYYLASLFERGRSQVSEQTTAIAGVVLVSVVPFLGSILELTPVQTYDHTPFGISVFVLGVGYVVFRYGFYELSPIARDVVLDETEDAMFVLDGQSRLVDYNTAATRIVTGLTAADIGRPFRQLHPELAGYVDGVVDERERELELTVDSGTRYVSVRLSEITRGSESVGTVVFLRDITERRRREQRLRRQNERLDQFASMVSHDLRNPLGVARGRAELIDSGDENVEYIRDALDRMETMIDDMLELARAGRDIEETTECSLADVVVEAWGYVDTGDSELDVRVENATVEADSTRLVQVFENLFRNALEHNECPLTVRVGPFDSEAGFYVEDSGAGIPDEERGEVFDHGYTTGEDGNGLGLALVRDIVEAHDWTIVATESAEGGARFEVRTGT